MSDYTNIAFFINKLFPSISTGFPLEQGCPPNEIYPSLITKYAETTNNEFKPENLSVQSNDGWETVSVTFDHGGKSIKFKIEEVNNSDWISTYYMKCMTEFASEHLPGNWVEFFGEDWCTTLYIPKESTEEFNKIRSKELTFGIDEIVETCRKGDPNYELAEILAMSDENINSPDSHGDLALNVAITTGMTDKLWILSEQGSPCLNPHAKDKNGKSSFDIASKLEMNDVIEQLNDMAETYEWWLEQEAKRQSRA